MKPFNRYAFLLLVLPTAILARPVEPSRTEVVEPIHKDSFREIDGKLHGQRKQGGTPRIEKGLLLFDGSMDGYRQVDPQIAVGGGYIFHGTNNGFIIYDKKGNFVDGVGNHGFNGGIDPKLFYCVNNQVFGFNIWNPWDKEELKPVNVSVSESRDPTGGWSVYPVPAPDGRDGGGLGCSKQWVGYTFPGGKDRTFVFKIVDAKRGKPVTVYHFPGSLGQAALTQDDERALYFLDITSKDIVISRIRDKGNGTPIAEEVGRKPHGLEYVGRPPKSPQKGTDIQTSSGDRNPKNLVLQGGYLWFSHAVNCEGRAAVQWHQVRLDGRIVQTGLISDPDTSYIQTTIAVNKRLDVLVGFQETNENMYISPRMAYRRARDPKGELRKIVKLGEGQGATDGVSWGDYSGSVIDGDNLLDLWTIQSITDPDGKGDTVIARAPFSTL
jgi:hypothetical protein